MIVLGVALYGVSKTVTDAVKLFFVTGVQKKSASPT
jgi:hypothetical protein